MDNREKPAEPPTPREATAPDLPPEKSGSSGAQAVPPPEEAKTIVRVGQVPLIDESHLGAALGEVAETRGRAVATVAVAAFRDAFAGRREATERWEKALADRDRYRDLYFEESKKVAVLEERARGRTLLRRIQEAALAVGGLVAGGGLGWAITLETLMSPGGIVLAAGAIIFILGLPLFRGKD